MDYPELEIITIGSTRRLHIHGLIEYTAWDDGGVVLEKGEITWAIPDLRRLHTELGRVIVLAEKHFEKMANFSENNP